MNSVEGGNKVFASGTWMHEQMAACMCIYIVERRKSLQVVTIFIV